MKRTITLLCIICAVMLSTLASANPFDIMKKARERQVYYVKDIPGGSSGNFLPEIYRKSFRLLAIQCNGLPNGYDVIRWNVDIESIDESKGYSEFEGKSLLVIAESQAKYDPIIRQTYDIKGSYKDGSLRISSAHPVHFLADKKESNFQLLKGNPGNYLIRTPKTGKKWKAEFLIDEYGDGFSCEVSTYAAREPYSAKQWKEWIAQGTAYEKQRATNAKLPTTLFGKIELAKRTTRKDAEKVIRKAGGKIISDAPAPGKVIVKYDVSPIISEASNAVAIYVTENNEQILSSFSIKINPPTQAGQELPVHRVYKMLIEKYGNPGKDGYWQRENGKTRIILVYDGSAWTNYANSMLTYQNIKYHEIAEARYAESKKAQQKKSQNAL